MNEFLFWFVVFLLIALFVTGVNSLSLSSWLGKTMSNLLSLFDKLSKNDFSEYATRDSEDELGEITRKYNSFVQEVRKLIENIQVAAQSQLNASEEIASNNQALTERTSEQASSVEELSAIIEQLSANNDQNTQNSNMTEQIAEQSVTGINKSNKAVEETIEAMKNITEKALLIIQIARQTDILAINAAIEAARAGQMGKGFSVVAAEVRKLAENTKETSNQIDYLTKKGIEIAFHSGDILKHTIEQMQQTSELVKQVKDSSMEQNSGIGQINVAVTELNKISQENAATAEETASNSEQLNAQAHELFEIVSKFKI